MTRPLRPSAVTDAALALAKRLRELAHDPVDGLVRSMVLIGMSPEQRAIVLSEAGRHALQLAAQARLEALTTPKPRKTPT